MYDKDALESLLDSVYRLIKWRTYDSITQENAILEFISDLADGAAYMDPDRYEKAQLDGIREALQDGATEDDVIDAGYEMPEDKTDEEPQHA